ncbi:hypothetical protein ASPZODRAFT_17818 [Penicilliopsis zonata CBS 506.65]|uniref:Gamma-glutamylcyclotransferase AIG2-like domain-containing protein n=1 Tax=Penicilliopsis zonata CBS 506.65 TaxID=1073090 RepID=A0A1L9SCG0_9EURO|nr:hypothetical protein ASPZODRAFT_17818 [Penicilliopsis zonata CBS 506.65]OJJ44905.1 hypothetical protein ASPZODRAFT_17818 [Penicilliopsis zonata CBS 506.65]
MYPNDFRFVLNNTFSEAQVNDFLAKAGCSPRFVYGVLMLPTALKYYIDELQTSAIEQSMTPATLAGYELHRFAGSSPPVITRSADPRASVEGVLILGLDERQRNAIYELESGLMTLVDVGVEICQEDEQGTRNIRTIDAGAFVWHGSVEGLTSMGSTAWEIDEYLASPFYRQITDFQNRGSPKDHKKSPAGAASYGSSLESIKEEEVMDEHHICSYTGYVE